jgi:hypothetical protein
MSDTSPRVKRRGRGTRQGAEEGGDNDRDEVHTLSSARWVDNTPSAHSARSLPSAGQPCPLCNVPPAQPLPGEGDVK